MIITNVPRTWLLYIRYISSLICSLCLNRRFCMKSIWHRYPWKHTPLLSAIRSLTVRFADKNSKSLLKMLMAHIYLLVWHWSFYVQVSFKLFHILTALLFSRRQIRSLTLLLLNTSCPVLANSVDPCPVDHPCISKQCDDLDLHCLSWNTWISIKNQDQAIWLAGN